MSAAQVDVLVTLKKLARRALVDGEGSDIELYIEACRVHDALAELIEVVRFVRMNKAGADNYQRLTAALTRIGGAA